jgi:hypothetical protein
MGRERGGTQFGGFSRDGRASDVGAFDPMLTYSLSLLCFWHVHGSCSIPMAKSQPFPRLRATAIDGRLANIFIRQEQLQKLHAGLVQSADAILDAIIKDSGNTQVEAVVEYSLALASLKKQLAELDPEKELEDEYRVANGKDAADRREAIGIAYIEPTSYTFFYSVVVPLSVAIAAGNCVIVQVGLGCISFHPKAVQTLMKSLD